MMTISKVTRVTAKSGDFATVAVQEGGKIFVGTITLANANELEAFGNALVDVAHEMRAENVVQASYVPPLALDPSVEDAIATYADAHAAEAAS